MRICSLLPSATEIVCALGAGDRLVGVTHECDYPPEVLGLPAVTRSVTDLSDSSSRDIHNHVSNSIHEGSSIYQLDQGLLESLAPDMVLTQELCEVCAVSYTEMQRSTRLLQSNCQVVSLEPRGIDGVLESILQVGRLLDVAEAAGDVTSGLRHRIDLVGAATRSVQARPRVLALEWLEPPFVGGHWVPEMVGLAGGQDPFGQEGFPSYESTWKQIAEGDPEVVVVMVCGFDLPHTVEELGRMQMPKEWASLSAVRSGQVYAVDGSAYFSRPGPRVVDGLEILAEILHPELFPRRKPAEAWQRVEVC